MKAKINTNVISEQALKNVAKKWSKLWSQFCVKPSMKFANGIKEEMKQLLGLFTLPPPVPTTSADGNRMTFSNNSRPRKKGDDRHEAVLWCRKMGNRKTNFYKKYKKLRYSYENIILSYF